MKKYIRTENGIYEVIYFEYNEDIDMNQYFIEDYRHFNEHEIMKEADNIEELCDEFVCNNSLLKPIFIKRNDEGDPSETYHQGILNSFKNGVNYKNYNWFGAIWTEWGLKYVAKMNNEGELELI